MNALRLFLVHISKPARLILPAHKAQHVLLEKRIAVIAQEPRGFLGFLGTNDLHFLNHIFDRAEQFRRAQDMETEEIIMQGQAELVALSAEVQFESSELKGDAQLLLPFPAEETYDPAMDQPIAAPGNEIKYDSEVEGTDDEEEAEGKIAAYARRSRSSSIERNRQRLARVADDDTDEERAGYIRRREAALANAEVVLQAEQQAAQQLEEKTREFDRAERERKARVAFEWDRQINHERERRESKEREEKRVQERQERDEERRREMAKDIFANARHVIRLSSVLRVPDIEQPPHDSN